MLSWQALPTSPPLIDRNIALAVAVADEHIANAKFIMAVANATVAPERSIVERAAVQQEL